MKDQLKVLDPASTVAKEQDEKDNEDTLKELAAVAGVDLLEEVEEDVHWALLFSGTIDANICKRAFKNSDS